MVAGSLVGCGKAEETSGKDAKGSDNAKQELSGTIAVRRLYSTSTSCRGSWKEIYGEKFKRFYSSARWR